MLPKIKNIIILEDYLIHIYLEDGFDFIFDFKACLVYPCIKELNDLTLFKCAKFHMRMVYWDDKHDIHLDQMIPESYLQESAS